MKALDARFVVFNAAAALVGLAAVVFVVRSQLPSHATPCGERYHTAMTFGLERSGAVLTVAELQGTLGGRDVGLAHNVQIARLREGPVPVGMAISLPRERVTAPDTGTADGGMSFSWEPRALQGQTGACLSYQLMLPATFDPSVGGALPGIRGTDRSGQAEGGFVARPAWRRNGEGGADQIVRAASEKRLLRLESHGFVLPRGRWAKLDQELVLNTPKRKDGVYRIWVDGALVLERTDLEVSAAPMTVSGVAASVFYGSEDAVVRAPQDTKIWLSPLEVRWQQATPR